MAIDLITGHQGVAHISADQIASINNAMMDNYGANKVMRLVGGELTANGLTIEVGTGYWRANGFDMEVQEAETIYIDPTASGLSRIDNIYVEILQDIPTGSQRSEIVTVQGEAAASPVAPDAPTAPVLNTDILLQVTPLATVTVTEGAMVMTDLSVAYEMVTPSELEEVNSAVSDIVNVYGAKNLLPFNLEAIKAVNTNGTWSGNTYSYHGIIWTVNDDGTLTANGQVESEYTSSFINVFSNKMRLNPVFYDKEVILNGCPEGGHVSNKYKLYAYRAASSDGSTGTYEDTGNGTESFTWLNKLTSGNFARIDCTIYLHTQVTNLTFKPMIRLASIQDDTYVPYVPTNKELTDTFTNQVANSDDAYSPLKDYAVDEHCIYNNVLYKCVTACSAAAWSVNQNCFSATTLTSAVTDLNNDLSAFTDIFNIVDANEVNGITIISRVYWNDTGYVGLDPNKVYIVGLCNNANNFTFGVLCKDTNWYIKGTNTTSASFNNTTNVMSVPRFYRLLLIGVTLKSMN